MTTRMEYAQLPVARCLERMGRTVEEVAAGAALMAAHDDKHLAQLRRALEGRP